MSSHTRPELAVESPAYVMLKTPTGFSIRKALSTSPLWVGKFSRKEERISMQRRSGSERGQGALVKMISGTTIALRQRVIVAATAVVTTPMLHFALTRPSGSRAFLGWTVTLAATMTAGAIASGPVRAGRTTAGRVPVARPLAVGAAAVAVFSVGGVGAAMIPALRERMEAVIRHARSGDLTLVVPLTILTGTAEELFYRGAVYDALPIRYRVTGSTAIYSAVTFATGNPMLVGAAIILGYLTGRQRRDTDGVVAPMLVHAVWSSGMLAVLPSVVRRFSSSRTHIDAFDYDD